MKIRKATPKDFKQIAVIVKNEYKRTYKEKYTDQSALRLVKYYYKIAMIYVAEIDKKVVGFIVGRLEPSQTGWGMCVEEFAVDYKYQRKGIGRALMEKIEYYGKSKKVFWIYLTTSRKAPAVKFYKRMKYIPSKSTVFFSKKV